MAVTASSAGKAKTYAFQDELAPYPMPDLEETCQVYLRSLRPLLTDEQYEHSQAVVADFVRDGARRRRRAPARSLELRSYRAHDARARARAQVGRRTSCSRC